MERFLPFKLQYCCSSPRTLMRFFSPFVASSFLFCDMQRVNTTTHPQSMQQSRMRAEYILLHHPHLAPLSSLQPFFLYAEPLICSIWAHRVHRSFRQPWCCSCWRDGQARNPALHPPYCKIPAPNAVYMGFFVFMLSCNGL